MRKLIYILICCVTASLIDSCQKYDDSDLYGMWELRSITGIAPHGTSITTTANNVYWSFQMDLLSIRQAKNLVGTPNVPVELICRFQQTPDSLFITSTYFHFRDRDSLVTVPDSAMFLTNGVFAGGSRYGIDRFNKDEMVLSQKNTKLYFRKF